MGGRTENCLLTIDISTQSGCDPLADEARLYQPTLEEASVRLLRVVLFPAEGFPTSPIRGSRGIGERGRKQDG